MKCLKKFDLNCDLGEGYPADAEIMPYITSANIACGYHAGDINTMYKTVELAVKHKVLVGAHVSWLDKQNFGRTEMNPDGGEVYELVEQQLILLKEITDLFNTPITHVKPHGALYNQSAKDRIVANAIARAVKDFDANIVLFGLSNSYSISEAMQEGLKTANEAFADRSYQNDGSLTPRNEPGALLEKKSQVVKQVLQLINEGTVNTIAGKQIPVIADTVCIHGDGKHAAEFAKAIHHVRMK